MVLICDLSSHSCSRRGSGSAALFLLLRSRVNISRLNAHAQQVQTGYCLKSASADCNHLSGCNSIQSLLPRSAKPTIFTAMSRIVILMGFFVHFQRTRQASSSCNNEYVDSTPGSPNNGYSPPNPGAPITSVLRFTYGPVKIELGFSFELQNKIYQLVMISG